MGWLGGVVGRGGFGEGRRGEDGEGGGGLGIGVTGSFWARVLVVGVSWW